MHGPMHPYFEESVAFSALASGIEVAERFAVPESVPWGEIKVVVAFSVPATSVRVRWWPLKVRETSNKENNNNIVNQSRHIKKTLIMNKK